MNKNKKKGQSIISKQKQRATKKKNAQDLRFEASKRRVTHLTTLRNAKREIRGALLQTQPCNGRGQRAKS